MSVTHRAVKRSPLHQVLASLGARLSEVAGWEVVLSFGDLQQEVLSARSGVGLSDFSFTTKWDMQGADLAEALAKMSPGTIPETNRAVLCDGGILCRATHSHALWISERADASAIFSRVREQDGHRCLHLVDRTSGYGHLVLCGPDARPVLRKLTSLDIRESVFPHLHCAWAPMAGLRILLVRNDRRDLPAYEILVSRAYAEFLWGTVMEAGRGHRIRPLGFESIRLLGVQ
jgi:heterotetrameric sarcosine oxidase gamma subunit